MGLRVVPLAVIDVYEPHAGLGCSSGYKAISGECWITERCYVKVRDVTQLY